MMLCILAFFCGSFVGSAAGILAVTWAAEVRE
jgi:hypothetical protein